MPDGEPGEVRYLVAAKPRSHLGSTAGVYCQGRRNEDDDVHHAGDERYASAQPGTVAGAGGVRRQERVPAVGVQLQVLLRPGAA